MVMALMFAVGKFRSYLLPKKFVILTVEEHFPLVLQHMDVSACIFKLLVHLQEFEYTLQVESSTQASLAGLLTHRCYEKKLKIKPTMVKVEEEVSKLSGAHSLYCDGAYKRKIDKAVVGVVIYDEEGMKVFGKGLMLENVHSNNEAKYAALSLGLEWCLSLGIKRLYAFGDAHLLIKQVRGTWACKNQGLVVRLQRVKELLKRFEVACLLHVPRKNNQEADALANDQLQEVTIGAIALQQPQFQGSNYMPEILHFLEIGKCSKGFSKGYRQWLVRKATKFRLINDELYCKGSDQVLRRVPLSCEIQDILFDCHSSVCGGHFGYDITSRKILQAGFVWPSLHRDVQHWCQSYHRCQLAGDRCLTYELQTPILAYGSFEKWGVDAIGPLPIATSWKLYIIMGVDYMTRWEEATTTSKITTVEVAKFIF
ncbi:hypothetical protein L7F22_022974 [Adiantum nelumboides]|nr:hypothetical protein [Adiantum nelumboides]